MAGAGGDVEMMALDAGQGVGLATPIQPAADIVREVAMEADMTLATTSQLVHEE